MYKYIEFMSQNAIIRGILYMPDSKLETYPVVIMAHGFTTTINGMTADKYAEEFQRNGIAALLYDHRNLGSSDGEPRQEICFWVQARGYIDGIDFLYTQSKIDTSKIAIWGASLSAQESFVVGSIEERVKAIINLIPAFGDSLPAEEDEGQYYLLAKSTLLAEDIMNLPHEISGPFPIVSSDQLGSPSALTEITAYRWFIEYGGRYGTGWKNIVSFRRIKGLDNFHVDHCVKHLNAPILMVIASNDEMNGANNDVTDAIFNKISQPKKRVDIEGGHFGLLHHPSDCFTKASNAQVEFLKEIFKIESD